MAERLSFDTTFLIDLEKERPARRTGPAHRFLVRHQGAFMTLSCIALGEFAEGFKDWNDRALQQIASAVEILEIDLETNWLYAQNARRLRQKGKLIGTNDLWIACSALRHQLPLVTRNGTHFRRIPDLEVLEY